MNGDATAGFAAAAGAAGLNGDAAVVEDAAGVAGLNADTAGFAAAAGAEGAAAVEVAAGVEAAGLNGEKAAEGSAEGSVPGTLEGLKTFLNAEFCALRLTFGFNSGFAALAAALAVSAAGLAASGAGLKRLPNPILFAADSAGLKAFFAAWL